MAVDTAPSQAFGDWLMQTLGQREMSYRALARQISVHPSTIGHWVAHRSMPEPANCIALADALDLDRDFVLDLAGHRPDDRPPELDFSLPLLSFAARNQHRISRRRQQRMVELLDAFLDEEDV